jgi:hypothetical protein
LQAPQQAPSAKGGGKGKTTTFSTAHRTLPPHLQREISSLTSAANGGGSSASSSAQLQGGQVSSQDTTGRAAFSELMTLFQAACAEKQITIPVEFQAAINVMQKPPTTEMHSACNKLQRLLKRKEKARDLLGQLDTAWSLQLKEMTEWLQTENAQYTKSRTELLEQLKLIKEEEKALRSEVRVVGDKMGTSESRSPSPAKVEATSEALMKTLQQF